MSQEPERQVVLENKQVIAIFLGIALLCGIFFALGYAVGSSSSDRSSEMTPAEEEFSATGEKPSALPSPTYIQRNPAASSSTPGSDADLGFYQSVQEAEPGATLPSGEPQAAGAAAAADSPPLTPVQPPPPGILVQVSALTRREDAESLVVLLKEKKLPVLVTSGTNDTLFHVVVGPYETEGEAQRVRQLLEQEGFRPFIRR
jgi:cell division septation protein DedD